MKVTIEIRTPDNQQFPYIRDRAWRVYCEIPEVSRMNESDKKDLFPTFLAEALTVSDGLANKINVGDTISDSCLLSNGKNWELAGGAPHDFVYQLLSKKYDGEYIVSLVFLAIHEDTYSEQLQKLEMERTKGKGVVV